MPLFARGSAPKYLRLGDIPVTQAYLGDDVVFDGTVPAVASLPRATATATALPPSFVAGVLLAAPTATAVSEARVPTITAGGTVTAPAATATATALVPQISAGTSLTLPVATAGTEALVPDTQVVAAGEVLLPRAEATAQALIPAVSVVAQVSLPTATAVSEALIPAVAGGAAATLPAASGSAAALLPSITAGGALTTPAAQASAAALLPTVGAGGSLAMPAAAATASALVPTMFAGAYYTDDFNRANSTSIGSQWVEDGNVAITSNALALDTSVTTNQRRAAIYNSATATPYQTVEFTVATAPNGTATAGAVLRCNVGRTQMFILATYNGGWNLGRITGINGTYTAVGSGTATISTGTVVKVVCDQDSVWSVYLNGVKSGSSYRDTTWADSSHQYLGLFLQRISNTNSHNLDNFVGRDTAPHTPVASDSFTRASLGSSWTQASQNGGSLYLSSNELCAVGLPSSPISVIYHTTVLPSDSQVVKARIRWNGRAPEHSSMSVGLRANPNVHHGVHFWCTSNLMGICTYSLDLTAFTAATGTADYVSTSQFAEGAMMELRAEGTVYTALVDSVPVLQGTFTTAQVPLSNHYACIHGEDDSAVSGGGQPPANLDDWAAYVIS